ncbi:SgcJ/EcaC family oxidoreductase [Larkinella arboricola]
MKNLVVSLTVLMLSLSTVFAQSAADQKAVESLVTQFGQAFNAHDPKAFAAAFAEDADFTNWLGQSAHGRSEIEQFHVPVLTVMYKNGVQQLTPPRIRFLSPTIAVVDIRSEVKGGVSPDGNQLPLLKFLLNWTVTKEPNEQWLIKVMHNARLPE